MNIHKSKYTFGDTVYLVTDADQQKRLITDIQFSIGQVLYFVGHGTETSKHYEFELTDVKNEALRLGIEKSTEV